MFNPESQKRIEEMISFQRLNELQKQTYNNYPELFVPTEMLFINGKINNVDTSLFVDTGAQTTVISKAFAEKANLLKFVDTRYATLVLGVGQQKSLGRIWQLQLQIKNTFFVLSATVLEKFNHNILLGLDMMKRHHCVIDLHKKILIFGSKGIYQNFFNDKQIYDMKNKDIEFKIKKVRESLGVNFEQAQNILRKYQYNADLVIATEKSKKIS